MATPIPPGREGPIPHLVCGGCADAIEFYKKALGAQEVSRIPGPDGRIMHAEISINGRLIFLADDFPEYCNGKSQTPLALGGNAVTIHQYVEDCDAAVKRAEAAGAKVQMPPEDMFWGDRYAVVIDPFGHAWAFATHQRDLTKEELAQAMQSMFATS
jgi:uncharacterized glyoxalase superfamily protein PhnB